MEVTALGFPSRCVTKSASWMCRSMMAPRIFWDRRTSCLQRPASLDVR